MRYKDHLDLVRSAENEALGEELAAAPRTLVIAALRFCGVG